MHVLFQLKAVVLTEQTVLGLRIHHTMGPAPSGCAAGCHCHCFLVVIFCFGIIFLTLRATVGVRRRCVCEKKRSSKLAFFK